MSIICPDHQSQVFLNPAFLQLWHWLLSYIAVANTRCWTYNVEPETRLTRAEVTHDVTSDSDLTAGVNVHMEWVYPILLAASAIASHPAR